ncbi:MAG: iron-containing alcohol dehydrogenase, partial [Anaerolineae bacterium]|nr:iron-containing alcohol dehydrogenase [Anaerolineae bacterium]
IQTLLRAPLGPCTFVADCTDHTEDIAQQSEEGMRHLLEALIESGQCILDLGNSRSASGAEHHASHFWEMKLLQEHRPAILHGAKVGFALIQVAKQYARLRALSREEMLDRLEAAALPDRDAEIARIRQGYGKLADDVAKEHGPFLNQTPEDYDRIKKNIAENWDAIQQAAALVPPPEQIRASFQRVGGPVDADELGLSEEEVRLGLEYGHYLRNRFTVMKLSRVLDLPLA